MKDRLMRSVNAYTQKRHGSWFVWIGLGYWRMVSSGWVVRRWRRNQRRAEARAAKRRKAKHG